MRARLPPDLTLPKPERTRLSAVVLAASVGLHVILFLTLSISGRVPTLPVRTPAGVVILDLPPMTAGGAPVSPSAPGTRRGSSRRPEAMPLADTAAVEIPPPTAMDSARAQAGPARIGPGYARGRLWVRPLPLPPRELARRLTRSHDELVDSTVTAVIQAFLDSAAADSSARGAALPSWTTNIAGSKFGLDSKYLYIAGLKIPAAILALLPLPSGSNESRAFDRSGQMYQDLRQAAQRSATLDEFKDAIRDIRERKEREREFEKNRRTAPPPAETPDQ